jgi:hypothetical protein
MLSLKGVEIMCGGILPRTVLAQYPFVFVLKHFINLIPFQLMQPFWMTSLDIVECVLYSSFLASFNYAGSEM